MAKRQVDHELRCKGGSPLVMAVTLREGQVLEWAAPVVTERTPQVEHEHYIDGVLVATGVWPNMEPVTKQKQ